MSEVSLPKPKRLLFLDLFRGIFALIMLEGHTLRAFLSPAAQSTALFHYHELIHNLPGPAFLFASGAAFSIATCGARWESYHRWSERLGWRVARLAGLAALGYALHLSHFSLNRTIDESTPEQLVFLFSLNILQCIAFSALLLQLMVMIVPNEGWFLRGTAVLAILIGIATPIAWEISRELPWWVGTNFASHWNSIFPLFPYTGFQMAGAAWGCLLVRARREEREPSFIDRSRRVSLWLVAGSVGAAVLPMPEIYADFWHTGPAFFFLRASLLSWIALTLRKMEIRARVPWAGVVLLGRESLIVYAAHMVLMYGSAWNPDKNLLKVFGSPLPVAQAFLILVLLTGSMLVLSWVWNRMRQQKNWLAKAAPWSLAGYLAFRFVVA